jgi:hypothetical protein
MWILLPGIQAGPPEFRRLLPLMRGEARALPLPEIVSGDLRDHAAALAATLPPGAHDFLAASFGGLVAWALPRDRVRSLTTLGTLPYRTAAADRSGRAARLLRLLPSPLFRAAYRARVRASLAADGADADTLAAVRLPPAEVLAGRLRAIADWRLPAHPPVRATWMWGVTDPFVTWDKASVEAAGHEAVVLPGGHRPHVSHPSEVLRWLPREG